MKADTNSNSTSTSTSTSTSSPDARGETLKEKLEQMPSGKEFLKQMSTFVSEKSLEYDYLSQIQRYARLSEGEIDKMLESLGKSDSDDKRIRKKLTEAHLCHVVWIAKDYYHEEIPFWDVINEGTVAMVSAIGKFNPKKDSDFSEHILASAEHGIREFIVEESSLKNLPNALIEKINSIKIVVRKLAEELEAEPTRAQIAEEMNISEEELDRLINLAKAKEDVESEQEQGSESSPGDNAQDEFALHPDFDEPEYYEGSSEDDQDDE